MVDDENDEFVWLPLEEAVSIGRKHPHALVGRRTVIESAGLVELSPTTPALTGRVLCAPTDGEAARRAAAMTYRVLPHAEVARLDRFRFEADRLRSLVGQFVVRRLLAEALGVADWRDIELTRDRSFRLRPAAEAGDVSVAHAGSWAVGAFVSAGRVGVDIEQIVRVRGVAREAFLGDSELLLVEQADEPEAAATALWTLKESAVKLVGLGFVCDPRYITFELDRIARASGRLRCDFVEAGFAVARAPEPGYVLALAADHVQRARVELWDGGVT